MDAKKSELQDRIRQMENLIKSARSCLRNGDYFQCAVRLEEVARLGKFSEEYMNSLDKTNHEPTVPWYDPMALDALEKLINEKPRTGRPKKLLPPHP
jgi:hypothetical protein